MNPDPGLHRLLTDSGGWSTDAENAGGLCRLVSIHTNSRDSLKSRVFRKAVPMTTRTTLRLGGLAAAIVVSLALVSSASASQNGTTSHSSRLWMQHKGGSSTVVVSHARPAVRSVDVGPAARRDNVVAPVTTPVTVVRSAPSSSFDWKDAAIGALFGLAVAIMAVLGATTLRSRRGGIALHA